MYRFIYFIRKIFFNFFYLFFSFIFCFVSCNYTTSVYEDPNIIKFGKYDINVIPDKYNCGAKENTAFKTILEGGNIVPSFNITVRTISDVNYYYIMGNQNKNCPDYINISDYDFSDYNFVIQGSDYYKKNKFIVFTNCKFKSFRNDSASPLASRMYCIFNNCSFSGGVNSAYLTLNNCKIGGFTSDGMNPLREVYCNNLYIYDLMHEGNQNGTHVDGIQIYGDQRSRNNEVNGYWISKVETGEIHMKNIRFEIPSINFEGSTTAVNGSLMFALEYSDVDNCSFEDLYVNGAGFWHSISLGGQKNSERSIKGGWSHRNLILKNALVSNNYGGIFYNNSYSADVVENVYNHDLLFVSSVWKDESGTVHIIVSNDTKNDHELVVKTDKGNYTFSIPHCPSDFALHGNIVSGRSQINKAIPDEALLDSNGRPYTTYRWNDMPFDVDFTISGNPAFVVCYHKGLQIRYVPFDNRIHYYSELKN